MFYVDAREDKSINRLSVNVPQIMQIFRSHKTEGGLQGVRPEVHV